jgi:hypothetical protein
VKDLEFAVSHASIFHLLSGNRGLGRESRQVVLGRILLSGKVIEHDLGYRAERARIAELIPFRGTERSIMVLADRLGVGMAPAVEPAAHEDVRQLVGRRGPPPTRTGAFSGVMSGAAAGVLAIVGLTVTSVLLIAGVWQQPPIPLIFLSLSQIGRSAVSMGEALKELRDRRSRRSRRPKLVPPLSGG